MAAAAAAAVQTKKRGREVEELVADGAGGAVTDVFGRPIRLRGAGAEVKSEVISFSRWTDGPALYLEGLIGALKAGYCHVGPKRGRPRGAKVLLDKEHVKVLALWSKNYAKLLEYVETEEEGRKLFVEDYTLLLNFTINDTDDLEPGIVHLSVADRLGQVERLVGLFGRESVIVRLDPIAQYTRIDDSTKRVRDNIQHVEDILVRLAALGAVNVHLKFLLTGDLKSDKYMRAHGFEPICTPQAEREAIVRRIVARCNALGIRLNACCSPEIWGAFPALKRDGCVDAVHINRILAERRRPSLSRESAEKQPTRRNCRCTRSFNLGDCGLACRHGCVYCYGTPVSDSESDTDSDSDKAHDHDHDNDHEQEREHPDAGSDAPQVADV